MKKFNAVLIILYLLISIYFAVFNWEVFILTLDISVGFSIVTIPLIAIIFLFGFVFLIFQFITTIIIEYSFSKKMDKKEEEINSLKASFLDKQEAKIESIFNKIEVVNTKIDKLDQTFNTAKQINSKNELDMNGDKINSM